MWWDLGSAARVRDQARVRMNSDLNWLTREADLCKINTLCECCDV